MGVELQVFGSDRSAQDAIDRYWVYSIHVYHTARSGIRKARFVEISGAETFMLDKREARPL
jgi:hypothetical protein